MQQEILGTVLNPGFLCYKYLILWCASGLKIKATFSLENEMNSYTSCMSVVHSYHFEYSVSLSLINSLYIYEAPIV